MIQDVTSGEVEQAKSIELSLLEDPLVLSESICKTEMTDTVDVVVSEFSFIDTATCKVERPLTMAATLNERSFIARCVYLVLATSGILVTAAVLS